MQSQRRYFEQVSLLITHYNRSGSLGRLLQGFAEQGCSFGEIIVSDDGSNREHIDVIGQLREKYSFTLVTSDTNRGLSNNINKGQKNATKPYLLYIQEDFQPKTGFGNKLAEALSIMDNDQSVDLIRFYSYFPYPYVRPYNSEFSELLFHKSLLYTNHLKFYVYSDHPHLRRRDFQERFGKFREGIKSDAAELEMALSFIKNKGKALLLNEFTSVIDQVNTQDEPSTIQRKKWVEKQVFWVKALRQFYLKLRLVKNTIQLSRI